MLRDRIISHIKPEFHILDVGAGAGIVEHMRFKGRVAQVCGIDLDQRVRKNPHLDRGSVADASAIPYEDNSFNLVLPDNVMEHLVCPYRVFSEIKRVLKPGGVFLFKTPNRNHYMPLVSRMTSHGFHQFFNRLRGRTETDTFPTYYRANSKEQVKKLADRAGLELVSIERIEGRPEYLRLAAITYVFGLLYERIVNAFPLLSPSVFCL